MAVQIASLVAKISADSNQLEKALKGVKGDLTSAEKGFATFQSIATKGLVAVGVAATAAFAAVGAAVAGSIKAAAEFEQGVADIGAVMNLTTKESADLQDHIMDLGLDPKLKVSATEASDAIMSLGTAGLSMSQIMNGASKATVQLSNSTGGDMARSAELLTDIMSQFNIEASDTGRVVDQVTGLTVASKFAFGDAALAIAQAGGMAGATGLEFEDFNAILGVTAANFSSGSDAGTSLKTFLTTLIPKSAEAGDMMRDLGLFTGLTGQEFEKTQGKINKLRERIQELDPTSKNYSDKVNKLNAEINELTKGLVAGGSAFFDANGNMKSAEEIAGALQKAFGGLSDARRNDALATIFGNDAMRTAAGLIDSGTAGIVKMKEEIGKVDAEEIAAKRMDTFAGAVEVAQGVMETISISIGQKFLPVLRPLVEQFAVLAQTHGPRLIDAFGRLAEKMAHAIEVGFAWMAQNLPPLWARLQDVGKAVSGLVKVVMDAVAPIASMVGKWVSWQDILAAVALLLGGAVLAAIAGVMAALAPVVLLVGKVTLAVAALREAWENNFLGIRDIAQDALNGISKFLQTHTSLWKGSWGKTLSFFKDNSREAWTELKDTIVSKFNGWTREVRHIVETWIDVTQRKIHGWVLNTDNLITGWVVQFIWAVRRWQDDMRERFGWFFTFWDNKIQPWVDKGRQLVQGWWDGIKEKWQSFTSWFRGKWEDLVDSFKSFFGIHSPSTLFRTYGQDMMAGLQQGIDAGANMVFDSMDAMNDGIAGKLEAIPGLIDRSQAVVAMEAFVAKMKMLEEASKTIGPYWLQPDYVPPASTAPPALKDPNGPIAGDFIKIPKTPTYMAANPNARLGKKMGDIADAGGLATLRSYAAKAGDFIKSLGQLQGSSAVHAALQRITGSTFENAKLGTIIGDVQAIIAEVTRRDAFDGTPDPQMERNNQLLEILINELRQKNLSVNLASLSREEYGSIVQFTAGLR